MSNYDQCVVLSSVRGTKGSSFVVTSLGSCRRIMVSGRAFIGQSLIVALLFLLVMEYDYLYVTASNMSCVRVKLVIGFLRNILRNTITVLQP